MAFRTVVIVFLLASSVCFGKSINDEDDKSVSNPRVVQNQEWPGFSNFVQISAVSIRPDGYLQMFHRGDRVLSLASFNQTTNIFKNIGDGPIKNDTMLIVDSNDGHLIYSWGGSMFWMPHGMVVDGSGNTWVTDIAFHQVLKFPPGEYNTPSLTIGERFIPGSDTAHLCQPTDVAITPEGCFFISDGYCNSRVLMFDGAGNLLKQIGTQDGFNIPHSLALVPQHDAVCVCDRQNGRIFCYNTGIHGTPTGRQIVKLDNLQLGTLYAIATKGENLFVVNGPDLITDTHPVSSYHGFTLDLQTGAQKSVWGPVEKFLLTHDITLSPDGSTMFVADVNVTAAQKVYKFEVYYD